MASISNDANGTRRLQYADETGKRQTVWLGKVPKSTANTIKVNVEAIVNAKLTATPMPTAAAQWLGEVGDDIHCKLVRVGLVEPREAVIPSSAALDAFTTAYIDGRAKIEDSTKEILHRARKNLVAYFGADRCMTTVTKGDATEFFDYLMRPKKSHGVGLKESTARKRYVHAASFFKHAALKDLIPFNPFDDNGVVKTNMAAEEYFFLPADDAGRMIDALPTAQLKLLFGLARWAGLRVGSEPRALKWVDIDWHAKTMLVTAKKTKRHKGKGQRVCPIFPELLPLLEARRAEAKASDTHVLPFLFGRSDASLRGYVERAGKKAGVALWPRMWQNLRATRQTELEDRFPSHVVCKWLGNSVKIAEKHYLRVNGSHYSAAAEWATPGTSQNPSHTTPIWSTSEAHRAPGKVKNPGKSGVNQIASGQGGTAKTYAISGRNATRRLMLRHWLPHGLRPGGSHRPLAVADQDGASVNSTDCEGEAECPIATRPRNC